MVQLYNFFGSWQLFPEKGNYEFGERPKSGIYKIESPDGNKEVTISHSWITIENQGFSSQYKVLADADIHEFVDKQFADAVQVELVDSISFELHFYRSGQVILHIVHEIMPNGYLKIMLQGFKENGSSYTNTEIYHKQLSVLPYSASVAGAIVKPYDFFDFAKGVGPGNAQ
jgi:hypothetical protein